MSMQARYEEMIRDTGCNSQLLNLVFSTGPVDCIVEEEFSELLGQAEDKFAYRQTIDGEEKQLILAVGRLGSLPKYNVRDEEFEYVKFEFLAED